MTNLIYRLIVLCPIVMIVFASPALAWSKFGHVLICEIAYREMSDDAREKLNALLDNQGFRDEHGELRYPSFNHGCLREDQVRNRPTEHYINFPRDWARVEDGDCPNWNKCLLSAIENDKEILADTNRSVDERLAAALALGHWIGDIHQPLHVSFSDDRGGNSINKRGRCGARNLHAVWDRCLVERRVIFVREPENADEYAEFTPMYRAADWLIADAAETDVAEWIASEPWKWAAESFDLARKPELGYCVMVGNTCQYTDSEIAHDGDRDNRKTVQITEQYLDQFAPDVIDRLTQAGFRLAATLDAALTP